MNLLGHGISYGKGEENCSWKENIGYTGHFFCPRVADENDNCTSKGSSIHFHISEFLGFRSSNGIFKIILCPLTLINSAVGVQFIKNIHPYFFDLLVSLHKNVFIVISVFQIPIKLHLFE